MTTIYRYILDGIPVTTDELIKKAREYGLQESQHGGYYPKPAIRLLEQHGHTVVENE